MPAKQSSAFIRNLKAKLQILQRPNFWGAAMLLSLPLIFLFDYWNHPQRFNATPSGSTLSDVDSSEATRPPVSDPSTLLEIPDLPNSGSQSALPNSLLQREPLKPLPDTSSQKKALDQKAKPSNSPAVQQFSAPSKIDSSEGFSAPYSGTSSASSGAAGTANQSSGFNPLQSALDRSSQTAGSGTDAQTGAQTGQLSQPTQSTAQTSPLGQSSTPSSTGQTTSRPSGFQPFTPQTSPSPGTTGYTLPPAFRTPTNTPANSTNSGFNLNSPGYSAPTAPQISPTRIQSSSQSSYGSTPGYSSASPSYSSPTYTSPQSQAQPAPFSVPNTPPGRYIGGGQINTFSNP